MNTELSCPIVRDLLPSYIDGLTAPETNAALEAHLEGCPDCTALLRELRSGEEPDKGDAREVDYLKTVRRRGRLRVVLAILLTAVLLIGGAAAKVFLIGSPASSAAMTWQVQETEDNALWVQVTSGVSANAWWGWRQTREGSVVTITCREGLVSPIHATAHGDLRVDLAGVTEVRLVDKVIWQEGTAIEPQTLRQWESRTKYTGAPAALGAVADALLLRSLCGDYTNTLQTKTPPYGWTLNFMEMPYIRIDHEGRSWEMERLSRLMLALVENLEVVGWTWEDDEGVFQQRTITLEEAEADLAELYAYANSVNGTDWTAPESLKDCADSPAALQRLRTVLKAAETMK